MFSSAAKAWIPRDLRWQMRQAAWSIRRVPSVIGRHGYRTAFDFVISEPWLALKMALAGVSRSETYPLSLGGDAPVYCRPYSSDLEVAWDVLVRGHFDWLARSNAPRRVLDCGANIGTATLAILDRWPGATVLAVEPDPDNYRLLVRNTAHLRERVITVLGAVWTVSGRLTFDTRPFRDGRQWSIRVREPGHDEGGAVDAYDLPTLLRLAGWERVDLLKMDIEGAETAVLSSAAEWLDAVDRLAVELHDTDAVEAFTAAVGTAFDVARSGELTIAARTAL